MALKTEHTPYTYRIHCIPTDQYYYGVRYAEKCKPADLWVKYFTSSKDIHRLIKIYGKDSFSYEIRRTFETAQEAVKWEERVNSYTINSDKYLNKNNGHRFSNESSSKGGKKCADLYKDAGWWNNGEKNCRSITNPGDEWVQGYIRGVRHAEICPVRVKGEKQHWWNNGIINVISTECPGKEWLTGMIKDQRHWWNNGIISIMSKEQPSPEWHPGYTDDRKKALSENAITNHRSENLIGSKPRGLNKFPMTDDTKKSYLGIVWWTNGKQECKARVAPDDTWFRGRLINKFNNNRNSNWWTNGTKEIRTNKPLSSEWIMGRKPKQLS